MARDPYRYFRIEAQELLDQLGGGLLELGKGGTPPELIRDLLRHAHTLKGAARVVKQAEVGDLAHRLEDLLSAHRGGAGGLDEAGILLDRIRDLVALLSGPPAAPAEADAAAPAPEPPGTVRLDVRDLDGLLAGIAEARAAATRIGEQHSLLGEAAAAARELTQEAPRPLSAAIGRRRGAELLEVLERCRRQLREESDRLARELGELAQTAADLRLVPAEVLAADLELTALEAARSVGRQVTFRASGTGTRIDAQVLAGLRGALRHLVLNAVAHGIEDAEGRRAAGKPAEGLVELAIDRRGHRAAFRIRDDGRGLDLESVRRLAVERGLVTEEAAGGFDSAQLIAVLLRGGLSTSRRVTAVSGRGIGLDGVRESVSKLRGEIEVTTTAGEGTLVEVLVPISLASLRALALEAGGLTFLVPVEAVRRTLRLDPEVISPSPAGDRLCLEEGTVVPFLSLDRTLGRREAAGRAAPRAAVVVGATAGEAALGADRLAGVREVVVRRLPPYLEVDPAVTGAVIGDDGATQLVLSPAGLSALASRAPGSTPAAEPQPPPPLLVIDDSLTTRMLEQSILEAAGYRVEVAVSGEEALAKALRQRYALFLVDVEMPGMDGFEFIARARSTPELREVPSVLVTSRAEAADKRRGKEVGARAYVVKSEFDQGELLRIVRSLVGG